MTVDVTVTHGRRGARPDLGAQRGHRREDERAKHARRGPRGRRPAGVQFGCDGVLCATPTGSTAYAFSAGGPVVWPEVEAMLLVPSNAHALFARPLVVSPESRVALEVSQRGDAGVLVCDGRRTVDLPAGSRVEIVRGTTPVLLVRLRSQPFTDRLVRKFELPVQGWRGRRGD